MQFQQFFKLVVLSILAIKALSQSSANDQKVTSKIVWVYIEDPQNMDFLERLCLENIRTFAEGSFYNLRVIHQQNEIDYLNRIDSYKQYFTSSFLDDHIIKKTLLQLSILQQFGGIWIDLPIFFTQKLDWIETIENQKYINNRITNWEIILFYYPEWFQKTIKRSQGKIQDIVVHPNYQSWFIASKPNSQLLIDCFKLLRQLTAIDKTGIVSQLQRRSLEVDSLVIDPQSLTEWLISAVLYDKQAQLDQYSQKASQKKQLAINYYKISGVNSKQTALYISAQSKGHTHLIVKYLTQIPIANYQSKFSYLQKIESKIANELSSILDPEQPMIQHLHSSVELVCEQETIPFRFIAKTSVIDFYLLKTTDLGKEVQTYDANYVRNHCEVTYEEVLFNFFLQYLLPLLAIALQIFIVRKAILTFKPQWGIRRSRRIQY